MCLTNSPESRDFQFTTISTTTSNPGYKVLHHNNVENKTTSIGKTKIIIVVKTTTANLANLDLRNPEKLLLLRFPSSASTFL